MRYSDNNCYRESVTKILTETTSAKFGLAWLYLRLVQLVNLQLTTIIAAMAARRILSHVSVRYARCYDFLCQRRTEERYNDSLDGASSLSDPIQGGMD